MPVVFANNTSATVTSGGTSAITGAENWTVTSVTGFPTTLATGAWFHVADPALPTEKAKVTSITGSGPYTWGVIRADEGSTVAHSANFTVQQVVSAVDFQTLQDPRPVYIDDYGSDPTGASTSDSAWTAAYAAAGALIETYGGDSNLTSGVVIVFGAGIYRFSMNKVSVTDCRIGLLGQGKEATVLLTTDTTANGVLVNIASSGSEAGSPPAAPCGGFTAWGWETSGSGQVGIQFGNGHGRYQMHASDMYAVGWIGTSQCGYQWKPDNGSGDEGSSYLGICAQNCTNAFVFDGSSSSGSADYSYYDLHAVNCETSLLMRNNVLMYGSTIKLRGNVGGGQFTGVTNTAVQVGTGSSDTSYIANCEIFLAMEADSGPSAVNDINVNTSTSAGFYNNFGFMSILNNGVTVTAGGVTSGVLQFSGAMQNMPTFQGTQTIASSGTIKANANTVFVTASSAVTGVILGLGGFGFDGQMVTVVNVGTSNSITFATAATSHVQGGTGVVIAAASGKTFVYSTATSLWYPV